MIPSIILLEQSRLLLSSTLRIPVLSFSRFTCKLVTGFSQLIDSDLSQVFTFLVKEVGVGLP